MIWANIDKPTRLVMIHEDDSCRHIPQKGTEKKPINDIGFDGGWVRLANRHVAIARADSLRFKWKLCAECGE